MDRFQGAEQARPEQAHAAGLAHFDVDGYLRHGGGNGAVFEETAHLARDIMVQIVQDPASLDDYHFEEYQVAGKTGTAQIPTPYGYDPSGSIASFIGFLPADDPVVSVLVKLDRPAGYWGSKTAAPVFQELVDRLVVLMEIPPLTGNTSGLRGESGQVARRLLGFVPSTGADMAARTICATLNQPASAGS